MSSSISSASEAERTRRGRRQAFGIFLVCLAPFVAAYLAYYFWKPELRMNYGTLVSPTPLPRTLGAKPDGTPLLAADLRGKWAMLQVDSGDCRDACERKLYNMRQVRLAQGKNMDRVERVWLVTDGAPASASEPRLYEGMLIARVDLKTIPLPAVAEPRDHIYVVDPLGNVMLRFPKDADPRQMLKDLQRLLKVSQIG